MTAGILEVLMFLPFWRAGARFSTVISDTKEIQYIVQRADPTGAMKHFTYFCWETFMPLLRDRTKV